MLRIARRRFCLLFRRSPTAAAWRAGWQPHEALASHYKKRPRLRDRRPHPHTPTGNIGAPFGGAGHDACPAGVLTRRQQDSFQLLVQVEWPDDYSTQSGF